MSPQCIGRDAPQAVTTAPSRNNVLGTQTRLPLAAAVLLLVLTACSTIGSLEGRTERFNVTAATYASAAILYNVLRASQAEPLDFVTLTGVTGHETTTVSAGLPTIIVGPGRTAAQNLFLFGPNTTGATTSNDYNVSVVDDPTSQAALLKPVDPATLGFFLEQGYNPDHVFFLFVSKIVVVDRQSQHVTQSYANEPFGFMQKSDGCPIQDQLGLNCHWQGDPQHPGFYSVMQDLRRLGLSVEVEPGFVPTQSGTGKARFCFDPSINAPGFQLEAPVATASPACRPALIPPTPQPSQAQTVSGSIQSQDHPPAAAGSKSFALTAKVLPPAKQQAAEPSWSFPDPRNPDQDVYVYTRSVYGAYRFLGQLLNLQNSGSLGALPTDDTLFRPGPGTVGTRMLYLTHESSGCWTSVDYEGDHWCVPQGADETKRTFQILHQLFRLFSSPNNQPVTQTVRTAS